MKKRFTIAFALLFTVFTIGIGTSILLHWRSATSLRNLLNVHQVEEMRHHLSMLLHQSQKDLQVSDTLFASRLDDTIANVLEMERAVAACFDCHHEPPREADLRQVADWVELYEAQFSTFVTAFLDDQRRQELQIEAARTAESIETRMDAMMVLAHEKLRQRTTEAIAIVDRSWQVLAVTLGLTFIAAVIITAVLAKGITDPVSRLVAATERLRGGDLGHQIEHHQEHEIGRLMDSFNLLSRTLDSNRRRIDGHVNRLQTLNKAVFSLYATPDAEALRDRLLHAMEELVPAEAYGTILQADLGDTFVTSLRESERPEAAHFHAVSGHKLAKIRESGDSPDLLRQNGEPLDWPFGPFDLDLELRNYLVGWIDFEGDLRGALIVINKIGGDFEAEENEILTALTRGVAEAIENIRLYQQARTHT